MNVAKSEHAHDTGLVKRSTKVLLFVDGKIQKSVNYSH
jgi:hypothetical protein